MPDTDSAPARERRAAHRGANRIERAVASMHIALDGLPIEEPLVALYEITNDRLGKPHRPVYVRERSA